MGWGGVVAQGLLGAAEGVGAAGAQSMLEKEKEDALARRDAALATLAQQTHAANAQASSDIATAAIPANEKAKSDAAFATRENDAAVTEAQAGAKARGTDSAGVNVPEGSARVDAQGNVIFQNERQERPLTPEAADLLKAQAEAARGVANRANADAAAINEDRKYKRAGGAEKPALPSILEKKDSNGNDILVDTKSGMIGKITPGEDAIPGQTHWYKPDTPGKPAIPMKTVWTNSDGTPAPGGIEARYPALAQRRADDSTSQPAYATASPAAQKGGVPAGATIIGTDRKSGRTVYELNGERYLGN